MLPHVTTRLATETDVPALRRLVNAAYKELADMGLNYTGATQDEAITRERMEGCDVHLVFSGEELVATVTLEEEVYEKPVFYISQLAVHPDHKRQGLGSFLLNTAEDEARKRGLSSVRLDTATTATHLVKLYTGTGYKIIDEVQWKGKSYSSYIMEKNI